MDQLPREIKQFILGHCNDKTKRFARVACREWFKITDYRNFVIYLTKKEDLPQIATHFASYEKPISLRFAKNIIQRLDYINEYLLQLTNLTALDIDYVDSEDFKLTTLSNLQHLIVHDPEYFMPVKPLLHLPNLTRIHLTDDEEGVTIEDFAQGVRRWTNLENCIISQEAPIDIELFKSYHTRLTHLNCSFPTANKSTVEKWFENISNLKELNFGCNRQTEGLKFLSLKSLTSLESLSLRGYHIHELNSSHLTQLYIFNTDEKVIEKELDKLINLRHFSVHMYNDEPYERRRCYDWLTPLTALEYLGIGPIEDDGLRFITTNLTCLKIEVHYRASIELQHLTRFKSLKHLYMQSYSVDRTVIPDTIASLTQLNSLELHTIELKLSFLSNLSNLTKLMLSVKHAEISNLPNLEELIVKHSHPADYVGFVNLPKLTLLSHAGSHGANSPLLSALSRLTTLKHLVADVSKPLRAELLQPLTSLEYLHIYKIDYHDYDFLLAMTRLTSLKISGYAKPSTKFLRLPTSLQVLDIDIKSEITSEEENHEFSDTPDDLVDLILARLPNLYKHSFAPFS